MPILNNNLCKCVSHPRPSTIRLEAGRRRPRHVSLAIVVCLAAVSTTLVGCNGNNKSSETPTTNIAPENIVLPPMEEVTRRQSDRVAKLQHFRSSGIIELRWVDEDDDSHFQQADIRLLMALPSHLALQVYKVGNTYMWLGSDDEQFWFFDMLDGDAEVAYVGRYDSLDNGREIPGMLHPMRLLDLIGLSEMSDANEISFDQQEKAWVVEYTGRGGDVRAFLDERNLWPVRVDSLDEAGNALYSSRLSKYESIVAENMPRGDFPKMAKRIEIVEAGGEGNAIVQIQEPTTIITREKILRAADLERLLNNFKPKRVEQLEADAAVLAEEAAANDE